ncbi:hypothetical protein [Qipengyuania marisflavi]|nr:hypothetical protein [Qipengyuania marisflavi]
MGRINRRSVLEVMGVMALAPLAALGVTAAPARATGKLSAPPHAMRLQRVLERELVGGAALVVTRDWECRFEVVGRGMQIAGRQLSCEVEAPAALAPLAALERQRDVTGLFPALLDADGRIVNSPATADSDMTSAVDAALAALGKHASADSRSFIAQLHQTSAALVSTVPLDLFFPAPGASTVTRTIPLPDGTAGELEITLVTHIDPASGLLDTCEKMIVSRIADTQRTAKERWTLAAF